ncbi:UDP-glucuronic acid decarboxylase 1-like, partial, partial [Paramuricea clavata]
RASLKNTTKRSVDHVFLARRYLTKNHFRDVWSCLNKFSIDLITFSPVLQPIKLRLSELEKDKKKYPPTKDLPEGYRKRILITGGAGFVGSHLTDALMMAGHEVTVVDNYFTGRKRNVEHWLGHTNFEMINHDVVEPLFIE